MEKKEQTLAKVVWGGMKLGCNLVLIVGRVLFL